MSRGRSIRNEEVYFGMRIREGFGSVVVVVVVVVRVGRSMRENQSENE